jgi:hypothetical protein
MNGSWAVIRMPNPAARRDPASDGAERQQPEDAAAQAVDRRTRLPAPGAGARRPVVDGDLAGHREQQGHRVVGDLVHAPVVGDVGHQHAVLGGRRDVDDVDAGAVARDHPAAGKRGDDAGADRRVLGHDRGRVAGRLDDLVLALDWAATSSNPAFSTIARSMSTSP